jgi:hypothetical protein
MVSELATRTLADLRSRQPGKVRDAASLAAAVFEHAFGHPQPAEPIVMTDPASTDELAALRDAMIGVVANPPAQNLVGPALFALGKFQDQSLIPFFVRWLVDHRHEDTSATHQALIGLNNLGEPTLSLEGGLSLTDPDLTLRQADAYLRAINAI